MKNVVVYLSLLLMNAYLGLTAQDLNRIEIRPGPEDGIDAEIRTDMNYPIWFEDDFISNSWTVSGNHFDQRSLIKFDLSSIPRKAEIVSATLSLFCNTNSGHHQLHSGDNATYLKRITSSWDQYTVKWNNQPSTTDEGVVMLPPSEYQIQDYPEIDITDHIKFFHENPDLNFGLMFGLVNEYPYRALVFSSSNHIDPLKRPLLIVEYKECVAPDTSFNYQLNPDNQSFYFTSSNQEGVKYWWSFGDGFYSDLPNPEYIYPVQGNYNVCLTASNNCDTLTRCKNINSCDFSQPLIQAEIDELVVSFSLQTAELEIYDYLWDFGDGFLSVLNEPEHVFNEPGNYTVCVRLNTNCGEKNQCMEVELKLLSDLLFESENNVNIFPNPAYGVVKISANIPGLKIESIELFDDKGTCVHKVSERNDFSFFSEALYDFGHLAKGVYTFRIKTQNGFITKKLILI